jgi:peptide/nickel transport system substrate-binding protein
LEGYGTMAHSFIGPSNEFWYNEDVGSFNYDAEKAVSFLKEAGYQWDENGKIHSPE